MVARRYIAFALVLFVGIAVGRIVSPHSSPRERSDIRIEPTGGTYDGKPLRPVSVRTGDDIRHIGEPVVGEPIVVYLEASGVPVSLSFSR